MHRQKYEKKFPFLDPSWFALPSCSQTAIHIEYIIPQRNGMQNSKVHNTYLRMGGRIINRGFTVRSLWVYTIFD